MNICFRVDASAQIGSGHFMRCLTLANTLKPISTKISFISRHLPDYLKQTLYEQGYESVLLNSSLDSQSSFSSESLYSSWLGVSQEKEAQDIKKRFSNNSWDWLIVDHYALDYRWESILRKLTHKIFVIDDLADRKHDCDILLDQNLYSDMNTRYIGKVPSHCHLLLGPKYCLIRDEFCQFRKFVKPRSGAINNILIYFGSIDSNNETYAAINALISSDLNYLSVDVVIGLQHPNLKKIQTTCEKNNFTCHIQTNKMSELMAKADFAIGAGGISTYERLYLRLPAILKPISENQKKALIYMSELGLIDIYFTQQELEEKLEKIIKLENASPQDCVEDGSRKVLEYFKSDLIQLIKTRPLDIKHTFIWLQDRQLREDFLMTKKPVRKEHFSYWRKLLNSDTQQSYSIFYSGQHVGNCGLKNICFNECKCELWIYIADVSVRGKGVAKSAIFELLTVAKNILSCTYVYLHVSKANKIAVHLYEKTGFVVSSKVLEQCWSNYGTDVIIMEQAL